VEKPPEPCLAEKMLCELIVQMVRKGSLSEADLAEIMYRLPEEGWQLLRALHLEAEVGDRQ